MKVFLDANVLISVLNKEYPVFAYSSRVLGLAENPKYKLFTSALCLAIAFYFVEKKSGTAVANQKLRLLCEKLNFTNIGPKEVELTTKNKKIHDLEDGLQYYSAIDSGCKFIITEDQSGFYFSEVEVLTSRIFFENHIL